VLNDYTSGHHSNVIIIHSDNSSTEIKSIEVARKMKTMPPKNHLNGTLWLFNIAMENGPFIDGLLCLPIKNVDFPWLC